MSTTTTDRTFGQPLPRMADAPWDRLAAGSFYSSARWVRYCASNAAGRTGLLTTGHTARPRAVAVVTEVDASEAGLYGWNDLLAARRLPTLAGRGAMLGVLQGYQGRFLLSTEAGPDDVGELVEQVRDAAADIDGEEPAAAVGMYLDSAGARAALAAGVAGVPVLLDLDAWLDLPPGGWEGWLATLPSKRRVAVRGERRRFLDAGYVVHDGALADCPTPLGPLARATQAKYGAAQDVDFYAGLLEAHVAGMGDAARVLTCERDGAVVGYCLYYRWNGTVHLRWAGFDYDRLVPGASEYFNLVYYELVARSATSGDRRLHAGIKASEAKALRGARLHPTWLLDLSPASRLAPESAAVRLHNAAALGRALADPRTADRVDPAEWAGFC